MRKKLSLIMLTVGLASFAFFLTLVLCDVIDFGFLWVKYVLSASALLFAFSLNMAIYRRTVFDEALSAVKKIKSDIETLGKKIHTPAGYIKVITLSNKLRNTASQIEDIISEYDGYDLKAGAASLRGMHEKYSALSQNKDTEVHSPADDTAVLEKLFYDLKLLKEAHKIK